MKTYDPRKVRISIGGIEIEPVTEEIAMNAGHPSNRVCEENLDDVFTYHADARRNIHYEKIRDSAKEFARAILENSPDCADKSVALRKVREAVMAANAAVALAPEYPWSQ
jgi:hypothetical protein